MATNSKSGTVATNVGRADYQELVRQGRLTYNMTRGFDHRPNPKIGHVLDEESGMRSGLTPEIYYGLCKKQMSLAQRGKIDICSPELEEFEWNIYVKWLIKEKKAHPLNGYDPAAELKAQKEAEKKSEVK